MIPLNASIADGTMRPKQRKTTGSGDLFKSRLDAMRFLIPLPASSLL